LRISSIDSISIWPRDVNFHLIAQSCAARTSSSGSMSTSPFSNRFPRAPEPLGSLVDKPLLVDRGRTALQTRHGQPEFAQPVEDAATDTVFADHCVGEVVQTPLGVDVSQRLTMWPAVTMVSARRCFG
jgi:hypothetical protein